MAEMIQLKINDLLMGDLHPPLYMGILNLSPESFYKASVKTQRALVKQAREFLAQGAHFLDLGGRSTAPKADVISLEEEEQRVLEALELLLTEDLGKALVSLDTQYSQVARRAFELFCRQGQEKRFVLNDVSCLCTDPGLSDFLAETKVPVILMASHEKPGDSLGIKQSLADLKAAMNKLHHKGYPVKERVILDPAIGYWVPAKKANYDLELVANLNSFRQLEQPLLVGISRKSFIGQTLGGRPPEERYYGSLAATAIAVFKGAHILRVHEIDQELRDISELAFALRQAEIKEAST
ncbi:MAG: dihydropteroate synthase [Spirochaetales bacterium]|nr:dihydropteroate synthase [Spirochaetales bacterium]